MMRLRQRVGALLAAAVVATGLSACGLPFASGAPSYHVTAYFPSAISLYPDSQVRVLGLPAGHVKSIKVIGDKVRVILTIPKTIPVPADVQATIIPLSFIGERYVQLFPAWRSGQPQLKPGSVIPLERTSVPVEPDEALAAVKHLLDSIDPQATGRLVTNLAADLDGTGHDLNAALAGLGTITDTLGSKDKQVGEIIDHFDKLTATLASRDQTLGRVLDSFATTTDALADERQSLQGLLASLASLSTDTLSLVDEHHVKLEHDLTVLSRTLRLVQDNVDQLDKVLLAVPTLVAGGDFDGKSGLAAAYNKQLHAVDLRITVTPALANAFQAIGVPALGLCVPVLVACSLAGVTVPPALPQVGVLPPGTVLGNKNQPSVAARKAKAAANAKEKKHKGLDGLIHSISSVFG